MDAMKPNDYKPFKERPGWEDVNPLPQDDGPHPLVPIAYSFEYYDTLDTFRAISANEEISARAFALTQSVIELSPAHYTVWLYRQRLLVELDLDLLNELSFIEELAESNPKCYQLWQHRQFVVDRLGSAEREDQFFLSVIVEDSKNFHAWTYRQWLIRRFELWDSELPLVEQLLREDVRNNSAWNQRFYILVNNPNVALSEEVVQQEVGFASDKIRQVPFNECPWNYLKGLYIKFYGLEGYKSNLLRLAISLEEEGVKSRHLLGWFVDVSSPETSDSIRRGIEACRKLIEVDLIRTKYWTYQLEKLQALV